MFRLFAILAALLAFGPAQAATPVSPTYQNLTLLGTLTVGGTVTAQGAHLQTLTVDGGATIQGGHLQTLTVDGGATIQGAQPVLSVADTTALQALPVTVLAVTNKVRIGTYKISTGQSAPPVDYYLTQTACTPDGGSCFAAPTSGYYWHITPQTIWDPRWWGAYGDVQRMTGVVTTGSCSAGSETVTIAGASFVSSDAVSPAKRIVITDQGTVGGVVGTTYAGTITGYTSSTQISVSPCPSFSTAQAQITYYGHDDSVANNNADAFLKTIAPVGSGISGLPQLNGGGFAYGAFASPIIWSANAQHSDIEYVALGSDNMPLGTDGLLEIASPFPGADRVIADAAFLPVNACFASANGAIFPNNIRCKNWMGSGPTTTLTAATAQLEASITAQTTACTLLTTGQYSCRLGVSAINSTMLTGGPIGTAGTGYATGDYITLAQTGGTQKYPAIAVVNNVSGGGGVTGYTISRGGFFTSNPTGFSQASTTGSGTGFAISAPVIANTQLQLGQAIGDLGVNIPNGTYITAFLPGTSGGTGFYTIQNAFTTLLNTSSQPMNVIGLDVQVTGGSTANIGLVSRGNGSIASAGGIIDRTFVVGYLNGYITLNKAPSAQFTNSSSLTLKQDSNGLYLAPSAGVQLSGMTVSQDSLAFGNAFQSNIGNHYGCAIFNDSLGGTSITRSTASFGIANICQGKDATNNQYRDIVTTGASVAIVGSAPQEVNSPSFLSMDGANVTIISDFLVSGMMQFFAITPSSNSILTIDAVNVNSTSAQVLYAPGNTFWFYTEMPSLNTTSLTFLPAWRNGNNGSGLPALLALTSGSAGSYSQFTEPMLTTIDNSLNVNIQGGQFGNQVPLWPNGLNLNTTPCQQCEHPFTNVSAATWLFSESDANAVFDVTVASTLTIPNNIGNNTVNSAIPSSWVVPIIAKRTTSLVTIVPGSGTTLFDATTSGSPGSSTSSFTMLNNYPYQLSCRNITAGNGAICFIR